MAPTGRNLVEGVFDLLHFGHVNIIYNAKQVSEHLCLGVNDDERVAVFKGFRPIYSFEERVRLTSAVRFVDEFIGCVRYDIQEEDFAKLNCYGLCHGSDIVPLDFYQQLISENRLIILPRTVGISSSTLINRLVTASMRLFEEDSLAGSLLEESDLDCTASDLLNYEVDMQPKVFDVMKHFIRQHSMGSLNDDVGRGSELPQQSLVSTSNLKQLGSNRLKSADDVVVYVDGAFDLIHSGHIDVLEQARELGTWTIVGLFDDASIRRMRGSAFPVISLIERAAVLLSMKYVDEVYFGTEWFLDKVFLNAIQPSIVIVREELITRNKTFAIRTRAQFQQDPYRIVREMSSIQLVEPKMSLTISDIYERVYNRRDELLPFISKRLANEERITVENVKTTE